MMRVMVVLALAAGSAQAAVRGVTQLVLCEAGVLVEATNRLNEQLLQQEIRGGTFRPTVRTISGEEIPGESETLVIRKPFTASAPTITHLSAGTVAICLTLTKKP